MLIARSTIPAVLAMAATMALAPAALASLPTNINSATSINLNGQTTDIISATYVTSTRTDIFHRGLNGKLYVSSRNNDASGPWNGINLNSALQPASGPSCVMWGASQSCFMRGPSNDLLRTDNLLASLGQTTWSAFSSLGGTILSTPSCVSHTTGAIDCFVRWSNNDIYRRSWRNNVWGPFRLLGGQTSGSPACVVHASAQQILCAIRGTNNQAYWRAFPVDPNANPTTSWASLGGVLTDSPTIVMTSSNTAELYTRGTNNVLFSKSRVNGVWDANWANHGFVLPTNPLTAVSRLSGVIDTLTSGGTSGQQIYLRRIRDANVP